MHTVINKTHPVFRDLRKMIEASAFTKHQNGQNGGMAKIMRRKRP